MEEGLDESTCLKAQLNSRSPRRSIPLEGTSITDKRFTNASCINLSACHWCIMPGGGGGEMTGTRTFVVGHFTYGVMEVESAMNLLHRKKNSDDTS